MENNDELLNEFIEEQHNKNMYETITLYRGTDKYHGDYYIFPTNRLTSWSYSIDMANNFGKYVYECTFTIDDILIDTMLIKNKSIDFDENEVIILTSRNKIAIRKI